MAKTKADLIKQAGDLGVDVSPRQTVKAIEALIAAATTKPVKSALPNPVAKAGKRSAKSLQEQADQQAKADRQEPRPAPPAKIAVKPPRSRLERRSRNYRAKADLIDKTKDHQLSEAVRLAKTSSPVKFDATVELHINLGIDPKQADQVVRQTIVLPAGSGQSLKVAAITQDPSEAKKAGADLAGDDDLIEQISKGQLDFDILVATPADMPKLGRLARILGPKGLMPNPKSGTVTNDLNRAIAEAKAGRVEFRSDSSGTVHLGVGKVSFSESDLFNNVQAVLGTLKANKPASVKGAYIRDVYLTTSMGPSVKVDLANI